MQMKAFLSPSVLVLLAFFEVSMAYYSYPDSYASFADIDWSKRDNWISPAYGFSSMADYDWGWKKRSANRALINQENDNGDKLVKKGTYNPYSYFYYRRQPDEQDEQEEEDILTSTEKPDLYTGPLALASSAYKSSYQRPRRPYNWFNYGNRNANAYHSMADIDWGKKRKRHIGSAGLHSQRRRTHKY